MESLFSLFTLGFGATSAFLWISFFRMIRKNLKDPESVRRTAIKALLMLSLTLALQLIAKELPRLEPYPLADFIAFEMFVAIWSLVGIIININVTNNHPVTKFQKNVDLFTAVVMISASTWASITYIGFVFLPALGLDLGLSLLGTSVFFGTYAIWQFLD